MDLSDFADDYCLERGLRIGSAEQVRITARLFGRWLSRTATLDDTQSQVSAYLSGTSQPLPDALARLCSALGVSSDWLLGLSERKTRR